jgi:tetratricopeptide (TPR) repeat protein
MLSNSYEEAKAIANLGRLALQIKDYPHALVKLQQALTAMNRLGAMYDALALYHDLSSLFLAQGNYARAEEMVAMREREADRLGYMDRNVMDRTDAASCSEYAGCKEEAAQDCAGILQLSCRGEDPCTETLLANREKEQFGKLPEPSSLSLQQSRIG